MDLSQQELVVFGALGVCVLVIVITGLLVTGSPTGLSVHERATVSVCATCEGTPVCAAQGQILSTYASACDALCEGARIVYADECSAIPRLVA